MKMKGNGSEVLGGLFWLAVGIFFAVGGILLSPGTLRNPGPGFLPLIMSSLMICFSLAVIARGVAAPKRLMKRIEWKGQVLLVVAVFVYGLLLDHLGFLLSTFTLMCVLFGLQFTGNNRWAKVLLYAAATAFIGWLVFDVALKVPFPQGQLRALWR